MIILIVKTCLPYYNLKDLNCNEPNLTSCDKIFKTYSL